MPVLLRSRIRTPLFCTAATPGFTPVRQSCCPCCGLWATLVRVLPGLSSVQLLAAAVGRPWQDWKLVSAHGRVCDPVAEVLSHPQVFFLTGGGDSPATLCAKLTAAGLGAAHALVGENLGTPAEAIRFGLARELAEQTFAPLSVLLIEREALPSRRTPGLPDDAFIRGAVPMTKQEVRAAALAKLAVTPTDTLWDVGAGTGSVSVELALAAPAGQVYAVECDPEACILIQKNREKFAAYNLTLIEGKAPKALDDAACPGCCIHRRHKGQYGHRYKRCAAQKSSRTAVHCRHCAGNTQRRRGSPDRPRPCRGGDTDLRQPHKSGGQSAFADGQQPGVSHYGGTDMMQFLIAAPRSGSGKTTVTCAVLTALQRRGADPCAFKCGPDYIDPMFHRSALGVESHNLDLYLSAPDTVRTLYARYAAGHGAAVCEGAMGFYDGQGLTTRASAWELADTLTLPVLLVVQPKGASITLAAELQGLLQFRTPSHIVGILLNDCSESLYKTLRPMLEAEIGLPVVGYLPHLPGCAIESRHLGLKTAGEVADLQQKLGKLADALVLDWAQLAALTDRPAPVAPLLDAPCTSAVRIAVARDEAFCFAYAETLDALRDAGAELVFFSPLRDAALPENIGGLYLPGGYPELYARQLSENRTLRAAVREAVQNGLPTAAECGGFLYLGQALEGTDGKVYPMADVLPGSGHNAGRLVRFGYAAMTAKADSMLFHAGETLPIHEFHHWDSSENGADFSVRKTEKRQWKCGFANAHLYAGFPHLYWAGTALPRRFVQAAQHFLKHKG